MKEYIHLSEILIEAASEFPDNIAYRFMTEAGYQSITYDVLDQKAKALAMQLQKSMHPCCGERAMLLLPPGLDYVIAFFGCLYAGVIPVPAYPPRRNHHAERLQAIIKNAEAVYILTHDIFMAACQNLAPFVLSVDHLEDINVQKYGLPIIRPKDIAFLQYTSGSTRAPKGVQISHRNIIANLRSIEEHFGAYSKKTCCWLPPYHDLGLIGGILFPLFLKIPAILMAPAYFLQLPWRWLKVISEERVSISVAPNFAYDLCVRKISPEQINILDLSHWHYALNGSEPIRAETIKRFCDAFAPVGFTPKAMRPVYGLAEATLLVSAASWDVPLVVSQSVLTQGKVRPVNKKDPETSIALVASGQDVQEETVRIVDPKTAQPLMEGEVGEIWVRGKSVAQGYWRQESLTRKQFHAQCINGSDDYLKTGDLGFIMRGRLYITGRIKDMIIIRGSNHYPQDIEHTIAECASEFQPYGTAAFTLSVDGEEQLVILQEITRTAVSHLDVEAIIQKIRSAILARHGLQIQTIMLLKPFSLPKTSSGKIQRFACREKFIQKKLPVIFHWEACLDPRKISNVFSEHNGIMAWLEKWFVRHSKVPLRSMASSTALADLGLDSLIAAELAADLKKTFGINVDPVAIIEQFSVGELVDYLMKSSSVKNVESDPLSHRKQKKSLVKTAPHPLESVLKKIYFEPNEGVASDRMVMKDKSYIHYAGYNYLGMSGDPCVTEAVISAIKQYGTSVSASRVASGEKPLHHHLEKAIADLIKVENSLVYSSGHATNISVITHLFGRNDLILYDELCHNSILQGILFSGAARMAYAHNDHHSLEALLAAHRSGYERVLMISEGIFSMDGDIPDVPGLVKLKHQYDAFLMLDEAHSIGTLGTTVG